MNNDKKIKTKKDDSPNKSGNRKRNMGVLLAIVIIIGALVASFLYINTGTFRPMENERTSELEKVADSLEIQINRRDSLIDDIVATFSEIEQDLNQITNKEQHILVRSDENEFSKTKKEEIISDISFINSLLDENKRKIKNLNAKLHQSGLKISSLDKKIAQLENSLLAKDSSIIFLKEELQSKNFEIVTLNIKMDGIEDEMNNQRDLIHTQNKKLNTAFLSVGNFKELEKKGIVTKDGGFLWIGKNKVLQDSLSFDQFKEINILETKKIPLEAKQVQIITVHPSNSYDIVKDSLQHIAYLEIRNPKEFWKISNFAVIETKN